MQEETRRSIVVAIVSIIVGALVYGGTHQRPATKEDVLLQCTQNADARGSVYCLELAKGASLEKN